MKKFVYLSIIFIIFWGNSLYAENLIYRLIGRWEFNQYSPKRDVEISMSIFTNSKWLGDINILVGMYEWLYHDCEVNRIPGAVICREGTLFKIIALDSKSLLIEFSQNQLNLLEHIHFEAASENNRFKFLSSD